MPIWPWNRRSKTQPSEEFRKIKLFGNGLAKNNDSKPDICFTARTLIAVEEEWDDDRNLPLRPDSMGFVNRLAVYKKQEEGDPARFVGEQFRSNVGPVIIPPEMHELVFISLTEEFSSFDEAIDWILAGPLVSDGRLRESFTREVENHRQQN